MSDIIQEVILLDDSDEEDIDDIIPMIEFSSIQPLELPNALLLDESTQQLNATLTNMGTTNSIASTNLSVECFTQETNTSVGTAPTKFATSEEENLCLDNNGRNKNASSNLETALPFDSNQCHLSAVNEACVGEFHNELMTKPSSQTFEESNNINEKNLEQRDQKNQQLEMDEFEMFQRYDKRIKIVAQNEMKNQNIVVVEILDTDDEESISGAANTDKVTLGMTINSLQYDQDSHHLDLESEILMERKLFQKYQKRVRTAFRKENFRKRRELSIESKEYQAEEEAMYNRYSEMIHLAELREINEVNADSNETNKHDTTTNDEFTIDEYIQDEDVLFTRYEDVIVSAEKCLRKEQILIDKMKEVLQVRKDRRSLFFAADDS